MSSPVKHIYEFGHFQFDTVERVLLRDGEFVPLTQKLFDILLLLVENSGHIVEKDRRHGDSPEECWVRRVSEIGEAVVLKRRTIPSNKGADPDFRLKVQDPKSRT